MARPADAPPAWPLPATLRLGAVHLTVSRLDGSIAFYERSLGLRVHDSDGNVAALGVGGEDLLVLVEQAGAAPGGRHAGLYHYALLYPSRAELARAVRRLASSRTRIEGAADHGVSEAIYLRDPDDNGIELYADRPRDAWPAPRVPGDRVQMDTLALDIDDLMGEIGDEPAAPEAGAGIVVGHLHLHVGDVGLALELYRDVLGFEVMVDLGSAAFVSAGGYHHHLGFNVWLGPDVKPLPPNTAGLRQWTVVLGSPQQIADVRARVDAAGLAAQTAAGGFLVRDRWQTAVVFALG